MTIHRRDFLRSLAGGAAVAAAMSPMGRALAAVARAQMANGNYVVLFNMRGGYDGYSLFANHGNPKYIARKGSLAYTTSELQAAGTDIPGTNWGFQPQLTEFAEQYNTHQTLSIFHKIGYPAENLSHFVSQDVQAYAMRDPANWADGWVARASCGDMWADPTGAMLVNTRVLKEIRAGGAAKALVFKNVDNFVVPVDPNNPDDSTELRNPKYVEAEDGINSTHALINQIAGANADAPELVEKIMLATSCYTDPIDPLTGQPAYPASLFGNNVRDIGRLIFANEMNCGSTEDFKTNVFMTIRGGWDTHSNQRPNLMANCIDVNQAIRALRLDLEAQNVWDKTLCIFYTEFGRRNFENQNVDGSGMLIPGTDHGHGNVMFIFGGCVNGGMQFGTEPTDPEWDMNWMPKEVDFRQVFNDVFKNHLGLPQSFLSDAATQSGILAEPSGAFGSYFADENDPYPIYNCP